MVHGERDPDQVPAGPERLRAVLEKLDARYPFGPGFFLHHLAGYVRDQCPDPREALPEVQLHLVDGAVLDVCHVIGLGAGWVALAVLERTGRTRRPMRTELVPYGAISRVTIAALDHADGRVGFEQREPPTEVPAVPSPEEALRRAASPRSSETPDELP